MTSLLFYAYLILVGIWLLMSLVVFIFTVRHHPLSVTSWAVVLLYILISSQIVTITFTALGRYIPLRTLLQF
ncbi:hypothetical protein HY623_02455 [Candidatus Uhrbacteria bacterium]|nr:hypothetical protein [Candidatus Uhrbacteria bacterium]